MALEDCDLTMGWNDKLCAVSVGGIRKALPVPIERLDYDSLDIQDNEITVFDPLVAGVGGYMYELEMNLSSANYPINRAERGAVTSDIELNIVLNNDSKELREELFRVARNTCVWFVQKSDKTWICLGLHDGLRLGDGNEGGTGVTKTDPNGHSLTFVGQEISAVPNVDEDVIDDLITIPASPSA
jgi:hypothetical protein